MKVRDKGKRGEREVANALNQIVNEVRAGFNLPALEKPAFQRNQNQSATGGSDLSNSIGLDIEIKRQEKLCIESWWSQCTQQASQNGGTPILIFRQSRSNWRVMMPGNIPVGIDGWISSYDCRVEISFKDFLEWFRFSYTSKLGASDLIP